MENTSSPAFEHEDILNYLLEIETVLSKPQIFKFILDQNLPKIMA